MVYVSSIPKKPYTMLPGGRTGSTKVNARKPAKNITKTTAPINFCHIVSLDLNANKIYHTLLI